MNACPRTVLREAALTLLMQSHVAQLMDWIRGRVGGPRAIILTYHRVGGCDVMTRPTDTFRRDVAWLRQHFDCMTLAGLRRCMAAGRPVRRPRAVLTFDDGYRDNVLIAAPILQEMGVRATFFVATGFVGTDKEFPHDRDETGISATRHYPKVTWEDLRAAQNAGFEIGSHTVSHCDLGAVSAEVAKLELNESLLELNRQLGERPRPFAYPWGKRENMPADAPALIEQAGYYAAVTTLKGDVRAATDPMCLPRIDVGNGAISPSGFRARVLQLPGVGNDDSRKWR